MKRYSPLVPAVAAPALIVLWLAFATWAQEGPTEPQEEPEQQVQVVEKDGAIEMPTTLQPGRATLKVVNQGTQVHGLVVKEAAGKAREWKLDQNLQPGQTGTLSVVLRPGDYTAYCPVDEHAANGMTVNFKVSPPASEPGEPGEEPGE